MKYVIIGTAGHVDHGKTTLVKALTGVDTDRLKEEKQRGISIDLGFAALALTDDIMAGIVDVPGHERFLKNMLAGTGGIDVAMLVVAADEGVMPQTQEHLAMLNLYGIKHGIVVLNKIDKVDGEWLELVREDVKAAVADTFLQDAPICPVSAVTGHGMAAFTNTLLEVVKTVPMRDSNAPFRLWIDRVFTVKGYGIVVTGSVLSGTAKSGDNLCLYPAGQLVRVRGLECHGRKVETIIAGQRAAINIAGLDIKEIGRGMFLSSPERGQVSSVWDVVLDWHRPVASGTRVRVHLGTGEYFGRLHSYKDNDKFMRLNLEQPLAAGMGDRAIIRLYSPQELLGGATMLGPWRKGRKISVHRMALAQAVADGVPAQMITAIIAQEQQPLTWSQICRQAGYLPSDTIKQVLDVLLTSGTICLIDGEYYITPEALAAMLVKVQALLQQFHAQQPERAGLSREIVRQAVGVDEKVFDALLAYWVQTKHLTIVGAEVALTGHAERYKNWHDEVMDKIEHCLLNIGLENVDAELIGKKLGLPAEKAKLAYELLVRENVLIRIGEINVYRKTIQYIVELIHKHFQQAETLSVAELRDLLNTSRKVAVPLMEYLDLHKYTIRQGDVRRRGLKLRQF